MQARPSEPTNPLYLQTSSVADPQTNRLAIDTSVGGDGYLSARLLKSGVTSVLDQV